VLDSPTLRRTLRAPARPIRVDGVAFDLLDEWQPVFLAAVVATCVASVAVSQFFLTLALLALIVRLVVGRARLQNIGVTTPILAFGVWTQLSACFAEDPVGAHEAAKKLVLFVVLWIAVDSLGQARVRERVLDAALLGGLVLGAGCLAQYYFLGYDTLDNRPRGFLGHYMTSAGLAMCMLTLAVSRLLYSGAPLARPSRRDLLALGGLLLALAAVLLIGQLGLLQNKAQRALVALVLAAGAVSLVRGNWAGDGTRTLLTLLVIPVSAWSLVVSQTRSAWLGTVAGLAVALFLWAPRALLLIPAGVAFVLAFGPQQVLDRLTVTDASSRDRYYMLQAGIDIVAERPIFGVGPGQIQTVYPRYRWPAAPNAEAPHLHDNAIQIAAERGLFGLAFWVWMVFAAMRDALRAERRGARGERWVSVGALAVWTAVMAAGLFEYNFGDSEILMVLLLVAAAPYSLRESGTRDPAVAQAVGAAAPARAA
jgi:O-antigen ligase